MTVSISLGSGDGDLTVKDTDDATDGDQLLAIRVHAGELELRAVGLRWRPRMTTTLPTASARWSTPPPVMTPVTMACGPVWLRWEVDDDVPGLVIPVSSIDVTENSKETDKGNTAFYTVSLNHRPSADGRSGGFRQWGTTACRCRRFL